MRILILTQWFDPEPTPRGLAFAKKLQQQGHDIEIITGFPNYPGGKIYPGYKLKWRKREIIDDVVINRLILYPSHDQSSLKRILNHVSFFISSFLYGVFFTKKPDLIYIYSQPILVGLSGALISFFKKTPFVIDIQDLWPDSVRATGMLKQEWMFAVIEKLCKWIYKRAAHIVVLSPGFKKLLVQRGVSEQKIDILYNWCDEQTLVDCKNTSSDLLNKEYINIVFAGTMGKAQALESVIFAAKKVAELNTRIRFVFIGSGVEKDKLVELSKRELLNNIDFLPRVSGREIGSFLMASDILLVHLKDDPLFEVTIPSKIQAYLCMGKPILIAVNGDAADLILAAKAGISAQPEDVDSIANAALSMAELPSEKLAEMGQQGALFYSQFLSMDVGIIRLVKIFKNITEL